MIVKCKTLQKEIEIGKHKAIMWELLKHDIPVASSCRGNGACKWCKIQIIHGEKNLSEKTSHEINAKLPENERLACQCRAIDSIEIDTTYW